MKCIVYAACALLASITAQAQTATPLGSYTIDPRGITISGVSSGAFMAVQMDVAFSQTLSGAGSIAGGIYWCAEGDATRAQTTCESQPTSIQSADQIAQAQKYAAAGQIDSLSNLAQQQIYVYASPQDAIVNPTNSQKLLEFYKNWIDPSHIQFEQSIKSAHGFPTLNYGSQCTLGMLPWLLNCGFDGAGAILQSMYGTLQAKGTAQASHLLTYSQTDFGNAQTPLYAQGWIYVPQDCATGATCRLHVALHGCQMNPDFIQDQFAKDAGYNDWAESNHIIVLYPQSAKLDQSNPYACWDWYGFTGANYATQSGAQMAALKKMIDRVRGVTAVPQALLRK